MTQAERQARYERTAKGRETKRRYSKTAKGLETYRRYKHSPLGLENGRRYKHSPLGLERRRRLRCHHRSKRQLLTILPMPKNLSARKTLNSTIATNSFVLSDATTTPRRKSAK